MGTLAIHPNSIGRDVADAPKQGMWEGGVLANTLVPNWQEYPHPSPTQKEDAFAAQVPAKTNVQHGTGDCNN